MKHIKQYNDFVLNEEEGFFKNLLLSTILSLGISQADAQTIQQDSVKTEVVKNISDFNKSIIFNLYPDKQQVYDKLKRDLSYKIDEPQLFIDKYLLMQQDGTITVRPDFLQGLELHINRRNNSLGFTYHFNF